MFVSNGPFVSEYTEALSTKKCHQWYLQVAALFEGVVGIPYKIESFRDLNKLHEGKTAFRVNQNGFVIPLEGHLNKARVGELILVVDRDNILSVVRQDQFHGWVLYENVSEVISDDILGHGEDVRFFDTSYFAVIVDEAKHGAGDNWKLDEGILLHARGALEPYKKYAYQVGTEGRLGLYLLDYIDMYNRSDSAISDFEEKSDQEDRRQERVKNLQTRGFDTDEIDNIWDSYYDDDDDEY